MKKSAAQVLKDAQGLPEKDRLKLIEELLASWTVPADQQDDEAFLKELDRRSEEIRAGKAKTDSWDQVKKRSRAAVRGKK